MEDGRRVVNPKVLLPVAAAVLVGTSATAIYIAAGCSPDSSSGGRTVTTTSAVPGR
jgi:hypothetical protein